MFDPSKYKIAATADYEVLDVNGDVIFLDEDGEKPWTITVASPGTSKATKAAFQYKQAISVDLIGQSKGKKSTATEASERMLRAEFLLKITESTNAENLTYEGKTGMDALRAIYLDPYMDHVTTGVDKFHHDRGNFSAGSSKTSSITSATMPG